MVWGSGLHESRDVEVPNVSDSSIEDVTKRVDPEADVRDRPLWVKTGGWQKP